MSNKLLVVAALAVLIAGFWFLEGRRRQAPREVEVEAPGAQPASPRRDERRPSPRVATSGSPTLGDLLRSHWGDEWETIRTEYEREGLDSNRPAELDLVADALQSQLDRAFETLIASDGAHRTPLLNRRPEKRKEGGRFAVQAEAGGWFAIYEVYGADFTEVAHLLAEANDLQRRRYQKLSTFRRGL